MVAQCRLLVPALRERSNACDEQRRISDETAADFVRLGFLRVAQPERFGGTGLGLHTAAEMAMEIGLGCCSTAWMTSQWAAHNFWVGYFPIEAQEEYWATSHDVFSSTSTAMVKSNIKPVKGGFQFSGMWRFSSGIDHAEWVMPMAPFGGFLIPKADFTIIDDWHVPGLHGTGSKAFEVNDAFVPQHRFFEIERFMMGGTYGTELYDDPYYHVPPATLLPAMLQAPLIGMARGVLDLWEQRALTRVDTISRVPAKDRVANQVRFAESVAEVEAARVILRQTLREMFEMGASGEPMSFEDRARVSLNGRYAAKLALQAVQRLAWSGDASSSYSPNHLPRWVSDTQMSALSPGNVAGWDLAATEYTRSRWGFPSELLGPWATPGGQSAPGH